MLRVVLTGFSLMIGKDDIFHMFIRKAQHFKSFDL